MSQPVTVAATPGIQTQSFDVCVIGAGAAGLVLADILSRNEGVRVCLLEAGPDRFKDRKEPYFVRSALKEHLGVNEARVTAFGGATNTWGGGLIRLSAADFEALDGRPDTKWPIPFESMVPHYEAVERIFGFAAAPEGPETIFVDRPDLCIRRREIPILPFRTKNFGQRFGPVLRRRKNVTILCNADIERFAPANDGAGVSHLEVQIKDGARMRISAPKFVISAGTVNSILLAQRALRDCGASPPAEKTGTYFHDHLSFPIALLKPRNQKKFSRRFGYRFERGLMIGEHFDIETKASRLPGAFLHMAFDTEDSLVLRPVRRVLNAIQQRTIRLREFLSPREWWAMLVGLPRLGIMRFCHKRLYLDRGARIYATLDTEQIPVPQWKLERDAAGPDAILTWDFTEDDVALAARYYPICNEILRRLQSEAAFDIEPLCPDPQKDLAGFREHLKKTVEDALHNSGGLRMGAGPDAPVDPDLRLRGVPNVHVLSAAVFPRVGTSNSTLTIIALGHRLAQQLIAGQAR